MRGNNLDYDMLVGLLDEIAAAFPVLPPVDGPESIYKAVVVVFPDVTDFEQIETVKTMQGYVRGAWVDGRAVLPGHPQGGLRNPDFKAFNGPFAMLTARHMVITHYQFLCENEEWIDAYVARFALDTSVTCPFEIVKRSGGLIRRQHRSAMPPPPVRTSGTMTTMDYRVRRHIESSTSLCTIRYHRDSLQISAHQRISLMRSAMS